MLTALPRFLLFGWKEQLNRDLVLDEHGPIKTFSVNI